MIISPLGMNLNKRTTRKNQKAGQPVFQGNPAFLIRPGNPAVCLRSVAFRPLLTKGLALSWDYYFLSLKN